MLSPFFLPPIPFLVSYFKSLGSLPLLEPESHWRRWGGSFAGEHPEASMAPSKVLCPLRLWLSSILSRKISPAPACLKEGLYWAELAGYVGHRVGQEVNSASIAHSSTRSLGECSSGYRINVFASSHKQIGNPSDKPLISSSLAVCHEWSTLALMALPYRRKTKDASKYLSSVICAVCRASQDHSEISI